jgi:hypothetical protein
MICGTRRWRCGSPPGANPKEVSVRAGHTSVAFTLDRYGHLFEGHDDELRERLDAMHARGLQAVPAATVVALPAAPARPPRGPSAAHGEASNEEDPAGGRAWAGLMGGCAARDSNPEPLP